MAEEGFGDSFKESIYDVVIVGAGMAGISSAYHLLYENDFKGKVAILEARDRIGGRICGKILEDSPDYQHVELGANWIHGLLGNPIYELALKYNIINPLEKDTFTIDDSYNKKKMMVGVTEHGEMVPLDIIEDVYSNFFLFTKQCETYFENMQNRDKIKDYENSVGEHLLADIRGYLNNYLRDGTLSIRKAIFKQLLNLETAISSANDMRDVSLADYGSYEELPGGNLVIKRGYSSILKAMVNSINSKKDTKLNLFIKKIVTLIKWKGIGFKNENNKLIEILCDDGSVYKCSHVVVTVPLGVLKENLNIFEPELPQYKIDCIKSLGFGTVNKVFLCYKKSLVPNFIPPSIDEILCFWVDDDEKEAKSPKNVEWFKKIYSFSIISNHVLLCWSTGDEAKQLENLSDEVVAKDATNLLRRFLNKEDFPEPESVYITKWFNDEYSKGSYSYISSKASIRDIDLLAQPIYTDPGQEKPALVFAGEACHSSFYSTVHGAFLTGKKAAYYLLDVDHSSESSNKKS